MSIHIICDKCGKIVNAVKPMFGSLHICVNEEDAQKFRKEIEQKKKENRNLLRRVAQTR
jgi:hypothetical protein